MKHCPSCKTAFPTDYTHCPRDGSSLITIGEWAEGTLVRGKYRILTKVGQGGMGSVYKAMHARFKEVRAIKVISPELASDANFVRRFEQEAIITRRLQHTNAVRVEDIDEADDGRPFIVMEYIEGRSLKDVIEQEAPMDVHRVCAIVKQAAAALDAAHALGLVHRDIKPANIALLCSIDESGAPTEQVKVLDFGIAKLKEAQLEDSKASHLSHLTLTSTGVVIGTPTYMSPEQARGLKGDQLDGRSDIYSLGIVMYQMLTGELPLKADSTIEQLMAHINTPPRPIREVRLDVPEGVAAAVMRCLEKKRELRPLSGQVLISELEPVRIGFQPIPVRGPSGTRPEDDYPNAVVHLTLKSISVPAWPRRHWAWVLVFLTLVGSFAGVWYTRRRQGPHATEGVQPASKAQVGSRSPDIGTTTADSRPPTTNFSTKTGSSSRTGSVPEKTTPAASLAGTKGKEPKGDAAVSTGAGAVDVPPGLQMSVAQHDASPAPSSQASGASNLVPQGASIVGSSSSATSSTPAVGNQAPAGPSPPKTGSASPSDAVDAPPRLSRAVPGPSESANGSMESPSPSSKTERPEPKQPAERSDAVFYLCRPSHYAWSEVKMDVDCDGESVGQLNDGSYLVAKLSAGKHYCRLRDKRHTFTSFAPDMSGGNPQYYQTYLEHWGHWEVNFVGDSRSPSSASQCMKQSATKKKK